MEVDLVRIWNMQKLAIPGSKQLLGPVYSLRPAGIALNPGQHQKQTPSEHKCFENEDSR
jgi:hypothetical protein